MATLVTYGDRLITRSGRESWMKRPSVPLSFWGTGSVTVGDGRVVSYQSLYENQPWAAVVVNKLSRQMVRIPLRVYREMNDDGEADPVEPSHPLAVLLRRPFPRASQATLKQKLAFPALLHGNGLLWKSRPGAGAPPKALPPIDWRCVTARTTDEGEVLWWEVKHAGRPQRIFPEDVIHIAWESGMGDIGVSPMKQLGTTFRLEDSAQRYQGSSFDNGARPSGALVAPPDAKLDREARAELREEIHGYSGVDKAFQIALLTGGLEWKPFSHTAVEAELIEQRKLDREEIAAVYDVDPPLIGILDHATYSNVGEMHKMLYGPTLGPWLGLVADTLNAQLVDAEPRWLGERLFVAWDLTEVLRSNPLDEINAIAKAIGSGVMMPDEGRGRLRMRRVRTPEANRLYMPTNNMEMIDAPDDADPTAGAVGRAKALIARKMGGGIEPFNRGRFLREFKQDAPAAEHEVIADRLESAVAESGGDPDAFRRLTADL